MENMETGMLPLEEQFAIQSSTAIETFLERARLASDAWVAIQNDQQILKFKQEMSRIFGVYVGDVKNSSVELFGVKLHLNASQELCVSKATVTGRKLFTQKVPTFASFWTAYNEVTEKASQESGVELIKICSNWLKVPDSAIDHYLVAVELEPMARFIHDLYAKSGDSLKAEGTVEFDEHGFPCPTFHVYTDGFNAKDLEAIFEERGEGFSSAQFIWHPMGEYRG